MNSTGKAFILLLILFFTGNSCKIETYPSYYYLLSPYLRGGWERPEKVQNIKWSFVDFAIIEITWDPSLDPDTNQKVPFYFLYLYYEYPKQEHYYNKKYLYAIPSETRYILYAGDFRGKIFLIITAYDLGAESEISDIIEITIPKVLYDYEKIDP